MLNHSNKPDDYDAVMHKETRFVLFEKKEDVSYGFYSKILKYELIAIKKTLVLLESIILHKEKT